MITATFRLLAPLSHSAFGEDAGNAVPLRRFPVVSLPGAPLIPALSGNALRGVLRRLLMRELFVALDLGPAAHPKWDMIYAALANGGTLSKSGGKRVEPQRIREIREALPTLSVLGASLYSWMLPGHVNVGICWPVCDLTVQAGLVAARERVPAAGEIEHEYSATRLPDKDHHNPDQTGVGPMPYTIETLAAGVEIVSRITFAAHAPSVEQSAILHGLMRVSHLGGKSGTGLGSVDVDVTGPGDVSELEYGAWLDDEQNRSAAHAMILALAEGW